MSVILLAITISTDIDKQHIEWSLNSLKNGRMKPDKVLISYSGTNSDIENRWKEIIENIDLKCIHHQSTLTVFEHYKCLTQHVHDEDMVMFIRQGDIYAKNKVYKMHQIMTKYPIVSAVHHDWYGFYDLGSEVLDNEENVYKTCVLIEKFDIFTWSLALKGERFKSFFDKFDIIKTEYEGFMENIFCDFVLSDEDIFCTDDYLYYYRKCKWP
jgi:hypothetical protein